MWRGRHSFSRLASLIAILEKRSDSYLADAQSRDVDVYAAASESGVLHSRKHRPRGFEMTEDTQILAAIFKLLQQLIGVTAHDRRFRAKDWPTPETAAEMFRRVEADRGYTQLEDEIVRVSTEEFEAHIAAHSASGQVVRVDRADAPAFPESLANQQAD